MTLLLRSISDTKAWKNAFERDAEAARETVPIWAYREFTPAERDQGGLSVYEIAEGDRQQATRVASAYATLVPTVGPLLLIGVQRSDIEEAGLGITATDGETFDGVVNSWHREIEVLTLDHLQTLARLFVYGSIFRLERDTVYSKTKELSRAGEIELTRAFGFRESHSRTVATKLIEDKAAQVSPRS